MELAKTLGTWSKDRSKGVGVVIVGPNREIRSTGYNGFARGVNDDVAERHERPAKYLWTEHAERNAIYNAARTGVALSGCRIFVPWYPCVPCANAIAQVGIVEMICYEPDLSDPKWGADFQVARQVLAESGVVVTMLPEAR